MTQQFYLQDIFAEESVDMCTRKQTRNFKTTLDIKLKTSKEINKWYSQTMEYEMKKGELDYKHNMMNFTCIAE